MQSAQRRFEFLKSGRKHKKGAGGARTNFLSGVPLTLFDGPQDLLVRLAPVNELLCRLATAYAGVCNSFLRKRHTTGGYARGFL